MFVKTIKVIALGLATLLAPLSASAQEARVTPRSNEEIKLSFAPVVGEAAPAVVNVYASRTVRARPNPFTSDPFFRRFFGDDFFGMPQDRVQNSLGSGVIVRPDGVIVTNDHVVRGGDEFKVVLSDRREFDATLILSDERTDLAVLQINSDGEPLPFLEFTDSDAAEVGDIVLAIGNPFGVGQTVTSGIISALARNQVGVTDYQFFIQTDAAINPGNSGGALVDVDGRLLGVNSSILTRSGGSHGVGFAIPANMVERVVDNAIEGGEIERPWLGANSQTVTADLAESLGLDRPVGALITEVYKGGPADRAGLKRGDLILAIDDHEIVDNEGLKYRIATKKDGERVRFSTRRDDRDRRVNVTLDLPPENPARDEMSLSGRHPLAGATVANLSPKYNEEIGRDLLESGVILADIDRRSIASRYGFRRADKILTVNDEEIDTAAQLARALEEAPEGWYIELERRGRVLTLNTRR